VKRRNAQAGPPRGAQAAQAGMSWGEQSVPRCACVPLCVFAVREHCMHEHARAGTQPRLCCGHRPRAPHGSHAHAAWADACARPSCMPIHACPAPPHRRRTVHTHRPGAPPCAPCLPAPHAPAPHAHAAPTGAHAALALWSSWTTATRRTPCTAWTAACWAAGRSRWVAWVCAVCCCACKGGLPELHE